MKGLDCIKKDIKEFLIKAGTRAAHTAAQVFIATIGTATMIGQVDWKAVGSTVLLAVLISLAKSVIVGLPEMEV
jgi:hypothetical protein